MSRSEPRTRHMLPDSDVFIHYAPRPEVFPEVYAANWREFRVFAHPRLNAAEVLRYLLETYPAFEEHGWTERTMRISYVGQPSARKLWRIERI